MIENWQKRINAWMWGQEPEDLPVPKRWSVTTARLGYALIRDIQDGQITMRAMGLVYTTLLSLAPLLALAFSLLKGFGVHNAVEPVLQRFLAPLGEGAQDITDKLVDFIENIQVGVLGVVGLGLLLYTVISLIQKVEAGCNFIWQVHQPRSIGRRFSEYLSVLIVGPLVILSATSMTASVTSNTLVQQISEIEPFGTSLLLVGKLLPYIMYSAGFTFLFMFMPNTKVRFGPAAIGGVFSGVLWQTASLAFATFASSAGNVNAIYSSFAILIFLLIWLYVSWLIMLLGCRVAFLLQHPEQLSQTPYPPRIGGKRIEELTLLVMALVSQDFIKGNPPWTIERLARYLRAVPDHIHQITDRLVAQGILIETGEDATAVLPRRAIDQISVGEVLEAVRVSEPGSAPDPRDDQPHRNVIELMNRLDQARADALSNMSVRELAQTDSPQADDAQPSTA